MAKRESLFDKAQLSMTGILCHPERSEGSGWGTSRCFAALSMTKLLSMTGLPSSRASASGARCAGSHPCWPPQPRLTIFAPSAGDGLFVRLMPIGATQAASQQGDHEGRPYYAYEAACQARQSSRFMLVRWAFVLHRREPCQEVRWLRRFPLW
jgi:hypothetical protein